MMDSKDNHTTHKVLKNSLFLLMSRGLSIFITLAVVAIVARYIGVELFGLFAVVVAISMTLRPLADFGFDRIICREISRNQVDADLYLNTTIIVRIVFSFILIFIVGMLLYNFSTWGHDTNIAIMLAIITELIMSMGATNLSVIRAFERMEFELLTNTIHKVTSLIFIFTIIVFDLGFIGIFYARLAASVVYLFISIMCLHGRFVKLSKRFSFEFVKFIIKESYPLALFSLLFTLIFKVDIFFLNWLGNKVDVALFESPHRLIMQMQVFAMAISTALFPVLSRSAVEDSKSSLQKYYRSTYKFLLIIGILVSSLLFLGGKPLITMVFGDPFKEASISLRILSPIIVFLFLTSLQNFFLTATGRQIKNTISISVSLIINIVLDILLIPNYGFIGASIATLISYFSILIVNSYFIADYGIKLNLGADFYKVIMAGVIMSFTVFLNTRNDFVTLLLRMSIGLTSYIFLISKLKILSNNEIEIAKGFIFRRVKKKVLIEELD